MTDIETHVARAIMTGASDAIVATDLSGSITLWNAGAARMFGFTAREALGRSLDIIIPEALRSRHWDGYRRVMATGTSRYAHGELLAVPALTKNGARISIEFTMVVMRTESGQPSGAFSIIRDVTQRFEETRRLRQQLAARTAVATEPAA
jgi:PAS domain S-box-containing protein